MRSAFPFVRCLDGVEHLEASFEVNLVVLHLGSVYQRSRRASRKIGGRVMAGA